MPAGHGHTVEVAGLKARSTRAPYFVEWIKKQLIDEYGEAAVYRGGLRVKTTLDPAAQAAAEKAIRSHLDHKGDPSRPSSRSAQAPVRSWRWWAAADFEKQQFNVAVQGKRQPGSAFKPFVLATALDEGVSPEQGLHERAR